MRVFERPKPSFCAFPVLLVLVACEPAIPYVAPDGSTTGEGTSDSGHTTIAAPNEPDPSSDGSGSGTGSGGDTGEPPITFIPPSDGGSVSFECDLWSQDCPAGHKCMPWANDGGSSWNATKCSPIAPEPGEPGEPCTVEGNGTSGIDTCELGSMCWDVNPETNEGTCRAFCQGTESNPYCEDPDTMCGGPRDFPLCLSMCCPVEQDCPEGQACYAINDTFACAPDASGDLGAFRDPCEYINVCDPGLICLDAAAVPGCEGGVGCCTAFCVVGSSACSELDPAMDCVPWYEDGHAPPGYELTGVCIVPQ